MVIILMILSLKKLKKDAVSSAQFLVVKINSYYCAWERSVEFLWLIL